MLVGLFLLFVGTLCQNTATKIKRISFGIPTAPPENCPNKTYPAHNYDKLLTGEARSVSLGISDLSQNFLIQSIKFHIFGTPLSRSVDFSVVCFFSTTFLILTIELVNWGGRSLQGTNRKSEGFRFNLPPASCC